MKPNDERKPVFKLSPVEDDLTTVILSIRDQVTEDTALCYGARLMFVRLLDLAVRGSSKRVGTITISQHNLGERLGASARTIFDWKQQLINRGYLWMTSQSMPNTWPLDTYHIAAIDRQRSSQQMTSAEGMWGNGERRQKLAAPGQGARQPGQMTLKAPVAVRRSLLHGSKPSSKNGKTPENAAESRRNLPPSAEAGCDGEPKLAATESRSPLRLTAEAGCDGEPKLAATHSRSPLRLTAEAGCEHSKAKVRDQSDFEGGKEPPTPEKSGEDLELERWQASLRGTFPSRLEKIRTRLIGQREQAKAANVRQALSRKIKILGSMIEGPLPAPISPALEPTPARSAPQPASAGDFEQICLTNGRLLLADGQPGLLTGPMVRALVAAGDELPARILRKFPELLAQLGAEKREAGNPVPG
jgi:hypothetical protein